MPETFSEVVMRPKIIEIVRFLLEHPDEDFSQSELAEQVDAAYTTINKIIHQLEDFGAVTMTERGTATYVQLNRDSPYVEILEQLAEMDADLLQEAAQRYAEELLDQVEDVTAVVLFGSVASGWPTKDSDIDVLILVDGDTGLIEQRAQALADKYSREQQVPVSPLVMEEDQFKAELDNDAPLPTRIKENGITLVGDPPW
jgi:predicted nucleotidyltransferase/biotin operon repressor